MTYLNAMRFLNIDPFKHIAREDATVGALRHKARHVNLAPLAKGGMAPQRSRSVLSAADVHEMYARGDARLGEPVGFL